MRQSVYPCNRLFCRYGSDPSAEAYITVNQTGSTAKRGASFYFAGHCVGLPMIYWGMVPLIVIRLVRLAIIFGWQGLATWLPAQAYEFRWA